MFLVCFSSLTSWLIDTLLIQCLKSRVILFYVVSSIVTILGHMISNPNDSKSASDFKLLMQVSDLVQSFPITELSATELIQMQLVKDFSRELASITEMATSDRVNGV